MENGKWKMGNGRPSPVPCAVYHFPFSIYHPTPSQSSDFDGVEDPQRGLERAGGHGDLNPLDAAVEIRHQLTCNREAFLARATRLFRTPDPIDDRRRYDDARH